MMIVYVFIGAVLIGIIVFGTGVLWAGNKAGNAVRKLQDARDNCIELFNVTSQWVSVKQNGKNLAIYFTENGFRRIAIYGFNQMGFMLLEELKNMQDVEVCYAIDKNADNILAEIDVWTLDEVKGEVDVIVVTPIHYYSAIERDLKKKYDCPIISIQDVIDAVGVS